MTHSFRQGRDEGGHGKAVIYVMRANGKNIRRLTKDSSDDILPAWSPNGQKIAFSLSWEGNSDIYVMNADGRAIRQLTPLIGGLGPNCYAL